MKAMTGKENKQQRANTDIMNQVLLQPQCTNNIVSYFPPLQAQRRGRKIRTSRPGGSAKYIRKHYKGECQYVSRQRSRTREKGEMCGRVGTIRKDGSCTCWHHFNRAKRLRQAMIERIRASLQDPEHLQRLKEMIQLGTEELRKIEAGKHS